MFHRKRRGRKARTRRAQQISAAADSLLAQKENLDAMSWESVRDIAVKLVSAVDRGDRESAHALAADLQSIADDNVRVLYRFNIGSEEVMSGRRLASGMSVLPGPDVLDEVDAGISAQPSGRPAIDDEVIYDAVEEPVSSQETSAVQDDADDVGVLVNVEAVIESGNEQRPFRRHDVCTSEVSIEVEEAGDDPWEALADEAVLGAHSAQAQMLMAEARKRASEAASAGPSVTPIDNAPARENEGFLDFLRVLDTEHPPIKR